jgi:hypothetical protein
MSISPKLAPVLRRRLLWEKAVLLQEPGLPAVAETYKFSLSLEVLRCLEIAEADGDEIKLPKLRPIAERLLEGAPR